MPYFSDLKLFKYGLDNIKHFTVVEFQAIMHQLVFVIDKIIVLLHNSNYTTNQIKSMNKKLVQLYID